MPPKWIDCCLSYSMSDSLPRQERTANKPGGDVVQKRGNHWDKPKWRKRNPPPRLPGWFPRLCTTLS